MSNITASMVNELRQETGAGMMACKKALVETNGDKELAKDVLRKSLGGKAQSKMDRATGEGRIFTKKEGNKSAIVKIGCETDFVANNDKVAEYANGLLDEAISNGADSAMQKAKDTLAEFIGIIGENIKVEEIKVIESEISGTYVHSNGKIGVIVALNGGSEEVASDIAMHAAAMMPEVLDPSEIADSVIEHEKQFWEEELKGKPENIIENIMKGKEKKFRGEKALKTQNFVKDPSLTCEGYAKNAGGEIIEFMRISV
ncbi:translation elongation factor Ts [Candidatus Gracilibacteria bacterium]|nr:translation elongation factor Ts [Candidatus Gracilibacteria bacterium]